MSQCAFCPSTAKLSGEHIWSAWMGKLFPGKKRFIKYDSDGTATGTWNSPDLDMTAKVVCKPCNEGWMSNLEDKHAKPAMIELILGKPPVVLTHDRARSIARFAFKTAVIVDHMNRNQPPFFTFDERKRFASSLAIPKRLNMWIAGQSTIGSGRSFPVYASGKYGNVGFNLYILTYSVGHLIFQFVAIDSLQVPPFSPIPGFEHLAIPFWPMLPPSTIMWPSDINFIRNRHEFEQFSDRWKTLTLES